MMFDFDPKSFGLLAPFLRDATGIDELGRGNPNESARSQLERLTPASLAGARRLADQEMARACLAALWLAHNFLDESHAVSQEIDTVEGSYWHGILHRREPDFSNSKYWFRRVGSHPIFDPLAQTAREMATQEKLDKPSEFLAKLDHWDPFRFVDLCEAALAGKTQSVELCRRVAAEEFRLLFDYCYRRA
jgi:hypothetical protein